MSLARYEARRSAAGCLPWALLGGLGLLGGLALAAWLSLPRLDSVYPARGAPAASSRTPIRLTFSRPMDPASVQAGLALDPPLPGQWTVDGNTLIFTPAQGWPLGSVVTVRLGGGRSERGLPLLGDDTWTFTVGTRRLAYLSGPDAPNLWVLPIEGETAPQPVTTEPVGVYDFDVSPDGTTFIYAARRADGGADLRLIGADGTGLSDLLLCPGEACVSPAFSPDGHRIAYQRHILVAGVAGGFSLGAARVYIYDLESGADTPAPDPESRFARWAPDGRLGYLDTLRQAVVVRDLDTGAVTYVPNTSGEMGDWSPDGLAIVYPELIFPASTATPDPEDPGHLDDIEGALYTHLALVFLATNELVSLSGDAELVDDGSPAFSPDGAWLAFGRKQVVLGQWTPGRQLWLMRPDGSAARALSDNPLYNHSAFAWSPDGAWLAYMRFKTDEPAAPAEIWLVGVDGAGQVTADPRRLAVGYLPDWLP
jgi:Tol biopolymer transport system component